MQVLSEAALARVEAGWNRCHAVVRDDPVPGPDPARIAALAELPGMHWPYLTLVRASARPPLRDFTDALPGHRARPVDPARVRELVARGHTVKLQRVEDFDDTVRGQVAALQERFGLAVTAHAFVTPAEARGLGFHRDASHVLVRQLEGEKVWDVVRPPGRALPDAGAEEGEPAGERVRLVLAPGDALYLPHGWPHRAHTERGRSVHVTFTLSRPRPHELAAEIVAGAAGDARSVLGAAVERFGL